MYFADRAKTGNVEKYIYIIVSFVIGIIYILHWAVIPFVKPDEVMLIDDLETYVLENQTEIPEAELA